MAYIILDSSSVFSSGSFDIIRDSRRWLIIAGQENKAFAAQLYTHIQCVGGGGGGVRVLGLRQINTCRKVPLQVNIFR